MFDHYNTDSDIIGYHCIISYYTKLRCNHSHETEGLDVFDLARGESQVQQAAQVIEVLLLHVA